MRSFIAIWFALSISLFSSTSFAAEISLDAQNIGVAISGEIVKGDYRKLIIFLRSSD